MKDVIRALVLFACAIMVGLASTALAQSSTFMATNIVGAGTTTVKSGLGTLHSIVMNLPIASGTVTIYDNTSGSGTKIGTVTLPAVLLSQGPYTAMYDVTFSTGLTIVTTGALQDLTVSWR
jgi:hypothetical protein